MDTPKFSSGTLIPYLTEMVTMDTGTNHSGTSTQQVTLTDLPQVVANVGDGFPSNGQGAASGSIQAYLRRAIENHDTTSVDLIIDTSLFAKSGCCGGLQPGGEVWAWGEWLCDIELPDNDNKWKLTATLNSEMTTDAPTPPQFSASTVIVGVTHYSLPLTIGTPQSFTVELDSGRYSLTYQFQKFGMNNRGAGNTNEWRADVKQTLSLSLDRE